MSTMKNCARIIFGVLGISFLGFRLDATVPAGYYYAADGKHGAELKTALYEIISSMHTLGYGSGEDATWEGFSRTDRKDDGSVWDRYSDEIRYFDGFNAVGGMHIEHSFPKSWWGAYENNAYRDLHHLFPADGSANSAKNNLPLGGHAVGVAFARPSVRKRVGEERFGLYHTGESKSLYRLSRFGRVYMGSSSGRPVQVPRRDSPFLGFASSGSNHGYGGDYVG